MKYYELEALVIAWAQQKEILSKGNPYAQLQKTYEEVNELKRSLEAQQNNRYDFLNDKAELVITKDQLKDDLGDILVTLIIQAEMQGTNLTECLELVYNVISKRKGKMIDGQFVKN